MTILKVPFQYFLPLQWNLLFIDVLLISQILFILFVTPVMHIITKNGIKRKKNLHFDIHVPKVALIASWIRNNLFFF